MSDSTPTVVGQKSDVPRCRSGCIAYDINTLFATASGRLYDAVGIRQRWRAISLTGLLCQPSPPCPRQPSPPCLRQPSPPCPHQPPLPVRVSRPLLVCVSRPLPGEGSGVGGKPARSFFSVAPVGPKDEINNTLTVGSRPRLMTIVPTARCCPLRRNVAPCCPHPRPLPREGTADAVCFLPQGWNH